MQLPLSRPGVIGIQDIRVATVRSEHGPVIKILDQTVEAPFSINGITQLTTDVCVYAPDFPKSSYGRRRGLAGRTLRAGVSGIAVLPRVAVCLPGTILVEHPDVIGILTPEHLTAFEVLLG